MKHIAIGYVLGWALIWGSLVGTTGSCSPMSWTGAFIATAMIGASVLFGWVLCDLEHLRSNQAGDPK